MPMSGNVSYVNTNSDFYHQRSKKLSAEAEVKAAESKRAEDESKRAEREEKKVDIGPAAKISISKEAREMAAFHQLGNR